MTGNLDLYDKIARRAMEMGITSSSKLTLLIDLQTADGIHHLRLEDLLAADDFNFAHDICGIQQHIDRRTFKMHNGFVPRFAGEK